MHADFTKMVQVLQVVISNMAHVGEACKHWLHSSVADPDLVESGSGWGRIRTFIVGSRSGHLGPDPDLGLKKCLYINFLVCVKATNTLEISVT
jgi:hypothetical protein